ncbi:hypothetical protein SAMN05216266_110127 [Amycolatopsis marina]|uniref:Uncharacterized protein n=1 Tax=Amycolatopsis marina TaxID=490629 RepID=A0A1I1AX42_9PSEU|nr:hypothetical protein [Amycolatopsis marina]SFB40998.1 hypothetical protein SAMN05216266_110127 [Amycolatopsis marina]
MHPKVDPIVVPADSQLPSPHGDAERGAEYDRYFAIVRGRPDLVSWSRSCLDTQERVLAELEDCGLSDEQRCALLHGLLTVLQETLESWLSAADGERHQ